MSRRHRQQWNSPTERAYTYLLTGKVEIVSVRDDTVEAIVTVHDGLVQVIRRDGDGWTCTCPQTTDQCAHLIAVRRVVPVDLR